MELRKDIQVQITTRGEHLQQLLDLLPEMNHSWHTTKFKMGCLQMRKMGATDAGFPMLNKQATAPRTPPLMRKANYDQDAEAEPFSESGFYDDESTIDGEMTPLALTFGRDLPR